MVIRSLLSAVLDAGAAAVLGYAGFRIGLWAAPCGSDLADCFPLTPMIVVGVGVAIGLYFGMSYRMWRTTPGRKALRVQGMQEDELM